MARANGGSGRVAGRYAPRSHESRRARRRAPRCRRGPVLRQKKRAQATTLQGARRTRSAMLARRSKWSRRAAQHGCSPSAPPRTSVTAMTPRGDLRAAEGRAACRGPTRARVPRLLCRTCNDRHIRAPDTRDECGQAGRSRMCGVLGSHVTIQRSDLPGNVRTRRSGTVRRADRSRQLRGDRRTPSVNELRGTHG